ncbi:unnamed protein product [Polarella glacialis]|uniref:Uncharacterized protein n=1 Tax=Polarella glacialis TaxID=89957 RepID=A0A813LFQ3_POLGL|nr:unnamed protein product [Polarella glacialis]
MNIPHQVAYSPVLLLHVEECNLLGHGKQLGQLCCKVMSCQPEWHTLDLVIFLEVVLRKMRKHDVCTLPVKSRLLGALRSSIHNYIAHPSNTSSTVIPRQQSSS